MKPLERLSFWVTLFLILAVLGFIVGAASFRPDARAMPVGVSVVMLVVLVMVMIGEFSPRFAAIFDISLQSVAGEEAKEAEQYEEESPSDEVLIRDVPWGVAGLVFGSLLLFALAVLAFGFLIAVPLYILLFLRLYGGAGWVGSLGLAAGMTAAIYTLSVVLRADLYRGMVFGAGLPPF